MTVEPQKSASHSAVFITSPDHELARKIGRTLVEERLAACAHVLPMATSIYRWDGKTHEDGEVTLIAKTRTERVAAIVERVNDLHPYDVPQVIALPITMSSAPYLAWLDENTG